MLLYVVMALTISVAIMVLIVGLTFYPGIRREQSSQSEMWRLIEGDESIKIDSIKIRGQGKQILIADEQSTSYLCRRLRSLKEGTGSLGRTFSALVTFESGNVLGIGFYVPQHQNSVTVSIPWTIYGDERYFVLELEPPLPKSFEYALEMLRR